MRLLNASSLSTDEILDRDDMTAMDQILLINNSKELLKYLQM